MLCNLEYLAQGRTYAYARKLDESKMIPAAWGGHFVPDSASVLLPGRKRFVPESASVLLPGGGILFRNLLLDCSLGGGAFCFGICFFPGGGHFVPASVLLLGGGGHFVPESASVSVHSSKVT